MPRTRRWKTAVLIREAARNLAAHRVHTVTLAVVSAAIGFGVVFTTTSQITDIRHRFDTLIANGQNVLVVTADQGAELRGSECEALGALSGVRHAGGLTPTTVTRSTTITNLSVPVMRGTPGVAEIVYPGIDRTPAAGTAVSGSWLARQLGLVPGSHVGLASAVTTTGHETLAVSATAPPSPRSPSYDSRILHIQRPDTPVTSCLVEAQPGSETAVADVLNAAWFTSDVETFVNPYWVDTSTGLTPQQELTGRITAHFPWLGAAGISVLFVALALSRRAEHSLYRLLGAGPAQLALQLTTEFVGTVLIPLNAGVLAAMLAGRRELSGLALALAEGDCLRLVVLALLAPLVATLALARLRVLDAFTGA